MDKVNLGQTRLSYVLESYILLECASKQGYKDTFCME